MPYLFTSSDPLGFVPMSPTSNGGFTGTLNQGSDVGSFNAGVPNPLNTPTFPNPSSQSPNTFDDWNAWIGNIISTFVNRFGNAVPQVTPQEAQKTRENLTSGTAGFFTDPARWITIVIGLLLVFGGLYLLGTSSVADSLKSIAKGAVA